LEFNEQRITSSDTVIKTDFYSNDFFNTLHLASNAKVSINNVDFLGSIIDIDTHKEFDDLQFGTDLLATVDKAHIEEKKLFFSLLQPALLEKLNPVYGSST
jgi:uncharacterized protein (TIGR04255 family)